MAGGQFHHALSQRRIGDDAQPHRPAGKRRPARSDARSQHPHRISLHLRHRRATRRQDSHRRLLYQCAGCEPEPHRPLEHGRHARHRLQPKLGASLYLQSRLSRTAKSWWAAIFTSIGGQLRNRIARLDPITGLADSFNPNANGVASFNPVQPDGKILAGGFTTIGGQTRNRIARLDPTTGLADSFNPNANTVDSIAMQADGKILAGGSFTSIGGQTRNRIARLDPTTGLADSFDPNAKTVGPLNRDSSGRQDFGGRRFHQRIGGQRATASPGSMPRPAWRIRLTRTRTMVSIQSRCRRTARF